MRLSKKFISIIFFLFSFGSVAAQDDGYNLCFISSSFSIVEDTGLPPEESSPKITLTLIDEDNDPITHE